MRHRAIAAFTVALAVGCSSGSNGAKQTPVSPEGGGTVDAGPPAPTFKNVMKYVITRASCGGLACHDLGVNGFTIGLGTISPTKVYAELVNQAATGPFCKEGSPIGGGDASAGGGADAGDGGDAGGVKRQGKHIRVVPNEPENSLLYQKLAQDPPCGDPMPKSGTPDPDHIQLVHDWIQAGALNN